MGVGRKGESPVRVFSGDFAGDSSGGGDGDGTTDGSLTVAVLSTGLGEGVFVVMLAVSSLGWLC